MTIPALLLALVCVVVLAAAWPRRTAWLAVVVVPGVAYQWRRRGRGRR